MKAMTGFITSSPCSILLMTVSQERLNVFLQIWLKFPLGIKDENIGF